MSRLQFCHVGCGGLFFIVKDVCEFGVLQSADEWMNVDSYDLLN